MVRLSILVALLAAALGLAGCGRASLASAPPGPPPAPTPELSLPAPAVAPVELLSGTGAAHEGEEPLRYNGYEVTRRTREEKLPSRYNSTIEYATVSRHGRKVATLEGFKEAGSGAFVRFGLFPALGGETKQLVVEQTVHRGWLYWVADLSDDFSVVYFSGDYPVGHELHAADLDGDGRHELIQSLHTFWFFNSHLNNVNSPFISVVFKYDPKARKYLPANPEFRGYLLRDLEQEKARVKELKEKPGTPQGDLLGAVLEVTLAYLYAGMEQEGWDYFEQYDAPDRAQMKADVMEALREDSFYSALKRKQPGDRPGRRL